MSDFKRAIGIILEHEGGTVDNPNDPGGITNYGISMRFVLSELKKDGDSDGYADGDFDHDGHIDADDIRKMSITQAIDIYRRYWWDRYSYGLINDQDVATKIMDMSVNMGSVRAHILTQTAVNNVWSPSLVVDGNLGSRSYFAINECDQKKLISEICIQQATFYRRLAERRPSMKVFLNGWLKRAAWPFKVV